jgi:hypothetical protein
MSAPYQIVFLPLWLFALAACSGGSKPSIDPTNDPLAPYLNYNVLDAQLQQRYKTLAYTPSDDLPKTGHATYSGVIRLLTELSSIQTELAGSLDVTVDFGGAVFSGAASGFVDAGDRSYAGTLALDDGILDLYADPSTTFRAFSDLLGTLDGQGYSIRINADIYGDFHGSNPVAFAGGVAGQATGSDVGDYVYGTFVAIQ